GRTALAWAAAGAVIVNTARSSISEQFPSTWLYLQGLLFVGVILFLPKGIAGAIENLRGLAARRRLPGRSRLAGPTVPATSPRKEPA
ncbi:MAG: urea ABC transporter permease subunit UrtC, partial [Actinomycetota bacterium]|nr:urea ABC transporter permease subunit UrtC [Actinomycetota bacterium]